MKRDHVSSVVASCTLSLPDLVTAQVSQQT
jgi:hypothetical protein